MRERHPEYYLEKPTRLKDGLVHYPLSPDEKADLVVGVLTNEDLMNEFRRTASSGAIAVAGTEALTAAVNFKVSHAIWTKSLGGVGWRGNKLAVGGLAMAATTPISMAGGGAGEFLAYLAEGKDPTSGRAQIDIFLETVLEVGGGPIEAMHVISQQAWQRRQQIKTQAEKAAQAMDAWDADALRAAQVPEERIAELEGTSNPVKRMELAQQYLREADDVALEGIEYERLEDGGTRVRYPDGREATYPDAQSMVDGHIQWREGREVLRKAALDEEALEKGTFHEFARHFLEQTTSGGEVQQTEVALPVRRLQETLLRARAVLEMAESAGLTLPEDLRDLETVSLSLPAVVERLAQLQQAAESQAATYRAQAEQQSTSRTPEARQELETRAQRAEQLGRQLGAIRSGVERSQRRNQRLSAHKPRLRGKSGRRIDAVAETLDQVRQLGDDFKRRVAAGEDREAVIRDLTQQAIGQGVVAPNATPEEVKRVRVQGSNQVISEADFVRIVIRFQQGADLLTIAHEFGEAWLRLMVEDGVYSWEEVAGWVNAAREKLGEETQDLGQLSPEALQIYAREGWVDLYQLYLLDQHQSLNLPQRVVEYFRKLTAILKRAMQRALLLREALASVAVPAELKQSFEAALEMHIGEKNSGAGDRLENSSIALQESADSTSYALAHWDELGDIPDTHFELIPEFLEDGTEEELRILKRLQPSRRVQRRLFELRALVYQPTQESEGGTLEDHEGS